ncbi:hypothetical protein VP464E531_P0063 [Vibrio phage 464E53-1]|nr:hypothetical protein VP464E531_P0063 [Vibrio phage 464E53-1]
MLDTRGTSYIFLYIEHLRKFSYNYPTIGASQNLPHLVKSRGTWQR